MSDFYKQYAFLEKELQQEILQKGVKKILPAHHFLLREGQFISSFPLILKGLIRISKTSEDGNELFLYYLRENEVCALSVTCCMNNLKSNVMAVAEEESTVIMLPVSLLDRWMCEYSTWRQFIMNSFQIRFRALMDAVDAIAFMKLDERLIKFFSDRYQKSGGVTFTGSHQSLALQLNTSREVVSRLLKMLERDGKISLSRNFIDYSGLL